MLKKFSPRGNLSTIKESVQSLTGWKMHGAAMLAGLASVLSFAPVFAWPIMFITLPALVLLLDRNVDNFAVGDRWTRIKMAGAVGWSFGFGYFFASLFWIAEAFLVEAEKFAWALPFAVSLLPAGLAFFYAAATAAASLIWRPGPVRLLGLALAFMIVEWLRGWVFTGFPWNGLGYTLTANDGLAQWASVFGAYGLAPLAVLLFSSPVLLFDNQAEELGAIDWRRASILFPLVAVSLLVGAMLVGYWRLSAPSLEDVENVKLRLVQPNIPQREKWVPAKRREVFQTHLDVMTGRDGAGARGLEGITHVIWPESSFPFLILRSPDAIKAISDALPGKTHLIAGALRMVDAVPGGDGKPARARQVLNSLLALDASGRTSAIYDKTHLVPFGEYLPFQNILEAIGLEQLTRLKGGFDEGRGPRIFDVPGLPRAAPLICYEIIFPGTSVSPRRDQKWLLNVTNDAWFGNTTGPHQHFHQARIRAIEEGLPLVRVANTGISAIVDPYGRILRYLPLSTRGIIDGNLPYALTSTTYTTFGSRIILLELIILVAAIFMVFRLQRTK